MMINYFSSEAEASEGEKKGDAAGDGAMEEMQSLTVGEPEFLDLKTPWLDSPR